MDEYKKALLNKKEYPIMNRIEIIRDFQDSVETIGKGYVISDLKENVFQFVTMERAWVNNEHKISCIPAGRYLYKKCLGTDKIPYEHLILQNVMGRDGICLHRMNFYTDSIGCIGAGEKLTDINHDGENDITNSKITLDKILSLMPEEGIIDIIEKF